MIGRPCTLLASMEEASQHGQHRHAKEESRCRGSHSRIILLCCIELASMHQAAAAAAQNTTLCSCSDLLWRPAPPSAEEVVNWHDRLVVEVTNAEAHGVRHTATEAHACHSTDPGSPIARCSLEK